MGGEFKWRHFAGELILLCVRWYCKYGISYRDLEEMMGERGVAVDHTTLYRWVQRYAPELEKRTLWYQNRLSFSWRVDETYVRVKGRWKYLYRAIDKDGNTLDFLLADRRNAKAAKQFLAKALRRSRDWKPQVINTDKNRFFDVSSGLEEVSQGGGDEVDHGREGCGVAVAASACSGGLKQAVEAFETGVAVKRGPALQDAPEVVVDGVRRLAHGVEDAVLGEACPGVAQEVGDAPRAAWTLSALRIQRSISLIRQAMAVRRSEASSSARAVGLGPGEAAVGALQNGPAQGLGQGVVLGFGSADFVDGLGEHLHDVEPVDGDDGVLEGLADGGEEGAAHVADDLDNVVR